jgi:hypothetical protein
MPTANCACGSAQHAPSAIAMEIVGPLLENAARFAQARVWVSGDGQSLVIEDDGPG